MTRKNPVKHYDRNIKLGLPSPGDRTRYFVDRTLENVLMRDTHTSSAVLSRLRDKKVAVHGSRALIKQTPLSIAMRIRRKDWDVVVTKNAQQEASMVEDRLDRAFGSNMFYVKVLIHKGGYGGKVTFRVISRVDGKPVVDIKESATLPPTVVIEDVRYKTLLALRKRAMEILRNPKLKFRHEKARRDIAVVNRALGLEVQKRALETIIPW